MRQSSSHTGSFNRLFHVNNLAFAVHATAFCSPQLSGPNDPQEDQWIQQAFLGTQWAEDMRGHSRRLTWIYMTPRWEENGSTKWIRLPLVSNSLQVETKYFITCLAFSPRQLFCCLWVKRVQVRHDFVHQSFTFVWFIFVAVRRSKPAHVPRHAIQHGDWWSVAIWVWVQLHPWHSFEMTTVLWKIPSSPHWAWDLKSCSSKLDELLFRSHAQCGEDGITLHSFAQSQNLHETLESFQKTLVLRIVFSIRLYCRSLWQIGGRSRCSWRGKSHHYVWLALWPLQSLTVQFASLSLAYSEQGLKWQCPAPLRVPLIKTSTSFFLASISSCRDGIAPSNKTQMTRVTRGCCLWQKGQLQKGHSCKRPVSGHGWFMVFPYGSHDLLP